MQDPTRKAIEAIENAKASLDQAMTELEKVPEFDPATVAYAAHALKNYIAVSGAVTDLLKVYLSGHPDDQVRIWIEGLQHALQLMNHTVNQLVHSAKGIEPKLKFEKVDMGLSVEKLGGSIWCESRPGQGAVFSFRLPAFQEQKVT